jgi:folate-binding Fe-S cluster repair protein YgfZ
VHRYFFDLDAGTWDARDTIGVVLSDAGAARVHGEDRAEALQALRSCALDRAAGAVLAMNVRDETGRTVFRVSLAVAA